MAKLNRDAARETYWPGDLRDQSWFCSRHGCYPRLKANDKCVACHSEEEEKARIESLWAHLPQDLWKRARIRWKEDHYKFKTNDPFTLTVDDVRMVIPLDRKCPVLGIPFVIGGGMEPVFLRTKPYPTWTWRLVRWGGDASPALDKFLPMKGYVRGNIAVISSLANRIKSNTTDPEVLLKVAKWMESIKAKM